MRKRFQKGSLRKTKNVWIAQWWEDGHRRKRTLGRISQVTKAQAQAELSAILAPINAQAKTPSTRCTFGDFARDVYLPFYKRKWKRSTILTNEDRVNRHLIGELGARTLGSFQRDTLQDFLDAKAAEGLSFSVVAHLRFDLRQLFRLAVADGYIRTNPAEQLFTPRQCPRPNTKVMTIEEVKKVFAVLKPREQLIARLAILAGMRPGEIFALKWGRLEGDYADIRQRVYRGEVDTPKSFHSVRWAALSDGLIESVDQWRAMSLDTSVEAWVFPSEKGSTPLSRDNCWRRNFKPCLDAAGLRWINFQVMRKTHSCLLAELDVDPKVRADQMGHTVDVNENVYTRASLEQRRAAVNALETAIRIM
jgi:integrase